MTSKSSPLALFLLLAASTLAVVVRGDTITIGSQTGSQIFFSSTLPRIYNFGVTQTGLQNGLSITGIDVNVKGGAANKNVQPVIISVYGGLGGTGPLLSSGTIAASTLTNSFDFIRLTLPSPIAPTTGGYSVALTTANVDNYFIKQGTTRLTTNGTASVTTSFWVEDTNMEGTAGTGLVAAAAVQATYTLGTNAFAFGNYRVGSTLSATTSLVNTALVTSNTQTQALAVTGTTSGGVAALTGLPSPFLAAGGTSSVIAGLNPAIAGPNSGTATLAFSSVPGPSLTTGSAAIGSGTLTLSGTGYHWANAAYSGTAMAFGFIHRGAAAVSGTVPIGNQAVASATYQDSLDVTASTGNPLVAAAGFSGLAASVGGTTRGNLVVTVGTGTAGTLAGTVGLTLGSNANGVAGLANGQATVVGSPAAITTTGTVYTGQSTWSTDGGGEWGTLSRQFGSNWNWAAFDGSPGVDPGFANTDTATFADAVSSGTATVTVVAATPSIRALTFANASASYSLAGGSGGSLALLNAGTAAATVRVLAGTHAVSLPISLGSDTAWSVAAGGRLAVSGAIGGGNAVTKTDAGTLVFSGNNTYAGPTTVSAGTLVINGDQSAATGPVSVAAGATLAGSGTLGGDTTIAGTHTPGNSPGVQTVDGSLAYEAGSTVVWDLVANTNALLGRGASYDGIDVTGALTFSGGTSLDLVFNLAGSGVNWSDAFWDSSYSGTDGWLLYSGATSLSGFDNLSINGTDWNDGFAESLQTARPGASFGLHREGNDIYITYVAAVPEPSAVVLAGLGIAAVAWTCRRRGRPHRGSPAGRP